MNARVNRNYLRTALSVVVVAWSQKDLDAQCGLEFHSSIDTDVGQHVTGAIWIDLNTREIVREHGDTFVLKARLAAGYYDEILRQNPEPEVVNANTRQGSAG